MKHVPRLKNGIYEVIHDILVFSPEKAAISKQALARNDKCRFNLCIQFVMLNVRLPFEIIPIFVNFFKGVVLTL